MVDCCPLITARTTSPMEINPTNLPSSTTGKWRMCSRDINCIHSLIVVLELTTITSAVIQVDTASCSGQALFSAMRYAKSRSDLIQGNGRMAGSLTRFTLSDRSSGRIFNLFTSPAHTDPGFAEGYLSLLFSINAFVAQIISQPLIYSITS